MNQQGLKTKAERYLHILCNEIHNRRVGSDGNRAATAFFAQTAASFGFDIEEQPFACMDWEERGAALMVDGDTFRVRPSPYSLAAQAKAPLAVVATVDQLASAGLAGKIVLLKGELAQSQLMPKKFPFYNPEEHQHILRLLEEKQPLALVTATGRNPELAGGLYPFPLFEDGDFDIPSVYMTDEEGERLSKHAGRTASLESRAQRIPAGGCNIVARKNGTGRQRLVFCAHIDAKLGTPGALDNAAGVAVLLLLAELLAGYDGSLGVELLAVNGEDYYAASGEITYLAQVKDTIDQIDLVVNIDGAGYIDGRTAYSLYGCPAHLETTIRDTFSGRPGIDEGPPWFQSDHMIFAQNGVPAVAITTDRFSEFQTLAHTEKDTTEIVNPRKLVDLSLALKELPAVID